MEVRPYTCRCFLPGMLRKNPIQKESYSDYKWLINFVLTWKHLLPELLYFFAHKTNILGETSRQWRIKVSESWPVFHPLLTVPPVMFLLLTSLFSATFSDPYVLPGKL